MENNDFITIKKMFDEIAPEYDFLNRLLSLKRDVYWRRVMVEAINTSNNSKILDMACGTGDVIFDIAKQKEKNVSIYGADFSYEMLLRAVDKAKSKPHKNIFFTTADALFPPFKEQFFDAITIAFGIRNILDKAAALESFYNQLKKGGKLLILELTPPEKNIMTKLYLLYFQKILPLIGGFFSKNFKAYKYLPDSVMNFPKRHEFINIMKKAGFENVQAKKLTMGIATLFTGYKKETTLRVC